MNIFGAARSFITIQKLQKLKSNLNKRLKVKNSNKNSLTIIVGGTVDDIKNSWLTETDSRIRNSKYSFKVGTKKIYFQI